MYAIEKGADIANLLVVHGADVDKEVMTCMLDDTFPHSSSWTLLGYAIKNGRKDVAVPVWSMFFWHEIYLVARHANAGIRGGGCVGLSKINDFQNKPLCFFFMEGRFPHPLADEKPGAHSAVAVIVRPVDHLAMTALGHVTGSALYHVGILDVVGGRVFHVNDAIGNASANANGEVRFLETTIEAFQSGKALYFFEHHLAHGAQVRVLQRAQQALGRVIAYDGVTTNCQTVVLDLLFPQPEPQQVQLAAKLIHGTFEFWLQRLPVDEGEEPPDPKNVDQIIRAFKKTWMESLKAGAKAGGTAAVGAAFLGPVGILVGGVIGSTWAYATADDFDSVCDVAARAASELTIEEKILLLRRMQGLAVEQGCKSIRVLVSVNRTLLAAEMRK